MCININFYVDDNDHGDDDEHGDDDVDSSKFSSKIIIGVAVGSVSSVVLFIFILCIIYKKTKKQSTAGYLQHNSTVPSQPRFLRPFVNNSSHQNADHNEQDPLMYETSGIPESAVPSFTSPCNPWYSDSEEPPSGPTNNIVILPDDVPSYPPPDYESASNYPLLSPDVSPPNYTSVIPSNANVPHVTY